MVTESMVLDALQYVWDDFVGDTKSLPECFMIDGKFVSADFRKGNFVTEVTNNINNAELASETVTAHNSGITSRPGKAPVPKPCPFYTEFSVCHFGLHGIDDVKKNGCENKQCQITVTAS